MLKTAARLLLLRVLPGRLIPLVTVAEAVMLLRSVRRRRRAPVAVNDPSRSRTGPPPTPPGSMRAASALEPATAADAPATPASGAADGPATMDGVATTDGAPDQGPRRSSRLSRLIRPRSGIAASAKRLPHI